MLKHASIIITLVSATLYTLGLTFYQSYLLELNIEETQFPLAVDRVLFQGFLSVTTMGAKAIGYLYLTTLGVIIVAMIGSIFLELAKKHKIAKKIAIWSTKVSDESEMEEGFLLFSLKVAENASYLILFFLLGLIVLILSGKVGQEAAIEFKERCKTEQNYSVSIVMKKTGIKHVGYPVVCSNWQCAYYVDGKTIVLNKSDINEIITVKKNITKKSS